MPEKNVVNSKATEAQMRGKGTGNASSGLPPDDPAPPPGGSSAARVTGSRTGGAQDTPDASRKG